MFQVCNTVSKGLNACSVCDVVSEGLNVRYMVYRWLNVCCMCVWWGVKS